MLQRILPFLVEPPPPLARLQRPRHILLDGKAIAYDLRRSARRTIGLTVDEDGLHAAAPRWVKIEEVEAFIREKQRWVLRLLAETRAQRRPPFSWRAGASLPYLGRELIIEHGEADRAFLSGECLIVGKSGDEKAMRQSVIGWYKDQAIACFGKKIALIAPRLGVEIPQLRLSRARTQWGSCIRKSNGDARILLNWKLMHYEERLIEYVVAHELAHLRHMNHSPTFWRAVASVYPDYLQARRELRARTRWAPDL